MQINHTRIDDRLIHGQIITAWLAASQANTIVVADDKAANDSIQQTTLKLAVPSRIKVIIENLEDAAKTLNESNKKGSVLLIVRNPECAYKLVEEGVNLPTINVGNISNSKSVVGRTKLLQNIFVEPNDIEYLKKLNEKGIHMYIKAVPTDKSIDCIELLTKNGL